MKTLRTKTNGNVKEYDDEEARALLATGLFEDMEEINKDFSATRKRKTKTT